MTQAAVTVQRVEAVRAPIDVVTQRLKAAGSTRRGKKWRCPAHDDHEPSLSVSVGDDGRVLLWCHAHCSTQAVVNALGLTFRELHPVSIETFTSSVTSSLDISLYGRPDLGKLEEQQRRGELVPVDVGIEAPAHLDLTARLVLEDMASLMGLFVAAGEFRPMPYASTWCAERMGWPGVAGQRRASRAIVALQKMGLVRCTATLKPTGPGRKGTKCFEPGGAPLASFSRRNALDVVTSIEAAGAEIIELIPRTTDDRACPELERWIDQHCARCGRSLDGRRRHAIYCSGACRAAASRARQPRVLDGETAQSASQSASDVTEDVSGSRVWPPLLDLFRRDGRR